MRTFRYITGDVLTHTAAVAIVLFLVVFSGRFIKYLAEAAVGDITADVLLPVMFFKLPSFFELILPLALFIGILLSLGRMYADSEMVVLKACGLSPGRLAAYLMVPALAVSLFVAFLALELAPEGSARAQKLLDDPQSAESLQALSSGRFRKQQGGRVVTYAESIDDAGTMRNVFVVERERDGIAMSVTRAEEGEIKYDADTGRRYLELRRGTRYRGLPGEADFEAVAFEVYGELIPEREGSLRAQVKAAAIPTTQLIDSAATRDKATLYWRLSLPTLVPVVTLIAIALSRTDARRGRYARLGPALMLFLAYFLTLTQTRSLVEGGQGPAAFIATHIAFTVVGVVLLQWETLGKRWVRPRAA